MFTHFSTNERSYLASKNLGITRCGSDWGGRLKSFSFVFRKGGGRKGRAGYEETPYDTMRAAATLGLISSIFGSVHSRFRSAVTQCR